MFRQTIINLINARRKKISVHVVFYRIPEYGEQRPDKQNSELCKTTGGKGMAFLVLYILKK